MTELRASLILQLKTLFGPGIAQLRGELKGLRSEAQGLGAFKGPRTDGLARFGHSVREASQALQDLRRQQAGLGTGAGGSSVLAGTGRTALMLGGLYGGTQATRTLAGGTLGQAIGFEKAMAQVRKKVDAPDEAGFQQLEGTINRVAVEYGLARAQVAELVAEAGAAGIAFAELDRFMRLVAKASVAWDMNAPETAQKLAEIKAGTQMTLGELETLANRINGLGDNSAAKERDIVEMFQRAGAAARSAGVSFEVSLAALTAIRSTGLQPEIAARWFSAFAGGLRTIEDGTGKAKEGLKLLGLDAGRVAEGMKRDSLGTMLDLFDRLQKSPQAATAALKIFGKEWWDETARAAQALPELKKQLDYLRGGAWSGSLDKTLGIELATTANHLERFKALVSEIGDRLGRWALPPLNGAIDGLIKKYDELKERLENRPAWIDPTENPQWAEGHDPGEAADVKALKGWFSRLAEGAGSLLFGRPLTKDPARAQAATESAAAADAEALGRKQNDEAALLRIQASRAGTAEEQARLALDAGRKEAEARALLEQADRNRRAAGQAAARDMTKIEAGEQAVPNPLSARLPALEAERARLEALLAKAGARQVVQDEASGRFWNVEALRQQLGSVKSALGEVSEEAGRTGAALQQKLGLDLSAQGAATALSWAQGLRSGIPAVEAAVQALRAPILTAPALPAGQSRPATGGSARAPSGPANVQVGGIHIHGVQDPERAARIAENRLASAIHRSLTGAHHDGVV